MSTAPFADRLMAEIEAAGSPLCVGIDPFPEKIPQNVFGVPGAGAAEDFAAALIGIAQGRCAAVKIQLGLFEQFGAAGYAAAHSACALARSIGLTALLDAKRGDIGTTAEGYAQAALGERPGFDADVVTVNPYMGLDTLAPFVDLAEARGKGVAVLVRTSNPGSGDLQDLKLATGEPVWLHLARSLAPLSERLKGASGWSGLMVVAGATYPQDARALRDALPDAVFLVPGYGAQGGGAADALAGFKMSPKGKVGGLVNASRSVSYPPAALAARTFAEWREAVAEAIAAAAADLAAAARP